MSLHTTTINYNLITLTCIRNSIVKQHFSNKALMKPQRIPMKSGRLNQIRYSTLNQTIKRISQRNKECTQNKSPFAQLKQDCNVIRYPSLWMERNQNNSLSICQKLPKKLTRSLVGIGWGGVGTFVLLTVEN